MITTMPEDTGSRGNPYRIHLYKPATCTYLTNYMYDDVSRKSVLQHKQGKTPLYRSGTTPTHTHSPKMESFWCDIGEPKFPVP